MQKFDISILVVVYNSEQYIEECLASIFSQNFEGSVQIIILDDKSSDQTAKVIEAFLSKNTSKTWEINFQINSENIGSYLNLQKGLSMAVGEFVAYIEGDDRWDNKAKLAVQYEFLTKDPSYDAYATGCTFIDGKNNTLPQYFYKSNEIKAYHNKELWGYPPFQTSGVMFRNKEHLKLPVSPINTNCNDKILFVVCSKHKPIYYNPEKMIAYRYHENNLTSNYSLFQNTVSRSLKTNTWLLNYCGWSNFPAYIKTALVLIKTYIRNSLKRSTKA